MSEERITHRWRVVLLAAVGLVASGIALAPAGAGEVGPTSRAKPRDAGAPDLPPLGRRAVAEVTPPVGRPAADDVLPMPADEPPALPEKSPSAPGQAAPGKAPPAGVPVKGSVEDRATVQALHDLNRTQIQMGSLAKTRGFNKATRSFGASLMADHKLAERKLDAYLRKHGTSIDALVTTSLSADHVLLATRTGADFDREFTLQIIADHNKVIDTIETAASATQDAELRAVYEQVLPILRAHKRAAQDIVSGAERS